MTLKLKKWGNSNCNSLLPLYNNLCIEVFACLFLGHADACTSITEVCFARVAFVSCLYNIVKLLSFDKEEVFDYYTLEPNETGRRVHRYIRILLLLSVV